MHHIIPDLRRTTVRWAARSLLSPIRVGAQLTSHITTLLWLTLEKALSSSLQVACTHVLLALSLSTH